MLSTLFLSLASTGALAASAYIPETAACPSNTLVRSASGISDSEATWITSRKAVADAALEAWLATALPSVDTSSLPTLALSISGGGFRSLLTGAGFIQALDGRDSNLSTAGLYQAVTYHAGLSGGAWLLSAIAAENWPTISSLRGDVWEPQLAGGVLNSSSSTTVSDYYQIAADILAKGSAGYPVSLTDPWGRMISYQIMEESEGAVGVTLSDITSLSNFTSYNAPFPIITASKINYSDGECAPAVDEAIYEFNPYEFGSWSDDVSAFVQTRYLGSNITAGSAEECVIGFDKIDWVLGTSSMLLNEYICNASLGVDIVDLFPSSLVKVVEEFTPADEYGYALVPNPFKGFNSTTATETSTISDLDNLYIVDGGESSRNVPVLPLLEPTRNVSVLIVNDNSSDDDEGFPDGISLVLAYEATQAGRLAGRFPTVPAAGDFNTSQAQFFGCDEADAVTVIYLPNSDWTYASNTETLQLTYTSDETDAMIWNGNQIAAQGGDESWGACLACGIMLKEVGEADLPSQCASCLTEYCWSA
ncbi:Lysophospholipase 1 [Cytospora paraplurivora]|uniref:Lysophospholipase n=1 Tax=Cytospora paraplurivora TaxID=2898453 RepID=A0AAN9U6A0_9PEZI